MGVRVGGSRQFDLIDDRGMLATDASLVVTGWNQWLEHRSGLAATEVIGRALFELFPEMKSRGFERYYRQALDGQTVLLSQRLHGHVLPLEAGPAADAQSRMQQSARILPLVEGLAVRGTVTVVEDVTERVTRETELADRAREQTALARVARSALAGTELTAVARLVVGQLRQVLQADFAEFLELRPDGRSCVTLAASGWDAEPVTVEFPAPRRALAASHADAAVSSEDISSDAVFGSDEFLRSHGVASALLGRVSGRGALPFGIIAAYWRSRRRYRPTDLHFIQTLAGIIAAAAERKTLEAELRQHATELAETDRRKDEFLAMLAHELRNPLAPIRNALHVLRAKCGGDEVVARMGQMMGRQVGHMTRLIDDLLDVSRINSGKVVLRRERVELAAAIARAVETAAPMIEARRHGLSLSLPPDPVCLDADPTRLAQIFENLLTNAAKFTEEGGQIWLTAHREGDEAVIRVRDTGVGIPAEMLPRVFDLFTQVDRSLDRSQGGLGIGLTLVHRLVTLHGGRITVVSDGPGRGTEFTIRLPVLADNVADPNAGGGEDRPERVTPRRVVVVDDNVDSAESLATLLHLSGHDVRTAHDGLAAIDLIREYCPDAVVLDIGLPRIDGYEVARRLRRDASLPSLRLIAMSGYGQDEDRRRSHDAGFDHHLVKPVDLEELMRHLTPVNKDR
jgi:signal transduction histidine kinase